MNWWIKAMLCAYEKLPQVADEIDHRIQYYGSYQAVYLGTERQIDAISALVLRKSALINLKVIVDKVKESMDPESWDILERRYIRRDPMSMIADMQARVRSTAVFRLNKAIQEAVRILHRFGLQEEYFEQHFAAEREWMTMELSIAGHKTNREVSDFV